MMIQPFSIAAYRELTRASNAINAFIGEALAVKSRLSAVALMEPGVGMYVNTLA